MFQGKGIIVLALILFANDEIQVQMFTKSKKDIRKLKYTEMVVNLGHWKRNKKQICNV